MSQLDTVISYLPTSDGFLPKWLLFISVVSLGNSVQAYFSMAGSKEVYAGRPARSKSTKSSVDDSPVNELSARTFGTWTALSSIVRLYAAYHINDRNIYELAFWTFGIAFVHFVSEWLVFGTAKLGRGLAGPLLVSTGTGTWMLMQWSNYVK